MEHRPSGLQPPGAPHTTLVQSIVHDPRQRPLVDEGIPPRDGAAGAPATTQGFNMGSWSPAVRETHRAAHAQRLAREERSAAAAPRAARQQLASTTTAEPLSQLCVVSADVGYVPSRELDHAAVADEVGEAVDTLPRLSDEVRVQPPPAPRPLALI